MPWVVAALAAGIIGTPPQAVARAPTDQFPSTRTCYPTAASALQVCHAVSAEGVYYRPSQQQIGYNTQIISLGDGRFATVLHSEAEDNQHYQQATGHLRPGDSIKVGMADDAGRPDKVFAAPDTLAFRIWGSLKNPASPLYYEYKDPRSAAGGLSGGANPMVVSGRRSEGDAYFYMFFLGVISDGGHGTAWRNVLLEARTRDFAAFDVLARKGWVPFQAEGTPPAIVTDVAGHPIVSNQAAPVAPEGSTDRDHPPGSVSTAGVFGSIAKVHGRYYYFYTDQDAADPSRNHLYLRTADDISADGRWSEPTVVLDVPPEILIRVTKARNADRWALFYNCLRAVQPFLSDICLQYSDTLDIAGPHGIAAMALFDKPYDGVSQFALGLRGAAHSIWSGGFLKAQQFYMTDADGNLAAPPDAAPDVGGLLTWLDLPISFAIFGAPTYWAEWTVTPAK
jgi:hypothetical protein